MASCRDCYHYEVCRMHYQQKCELAYETEEEVRHAILEAEKGSPICEHFKDRSRFVELPCVGDKVYKLCRINQFGDYKIVESEIRGFIVDTNGTAFDYELLGERFFLTHEEAEQALKERGENENV